MEDTFTFILGSLAGLSTTVSFIPQAVKVFKSNSTKDISLGMFSLMSTGVFLWLIYGLKMNSIPIIVANAVSLVVCLLVLYKKIRLDVLKKAH